MTRRGGARLRGVLLDVDGTLIDSNEAHARAWSEVLGEFGFDVPVERVRPLVGMGGDKLLPKVTGLSEDTERGQAIAKRRDEVFAERYLPTLRAFPGAHELIARLKASGFRLVIATSSKAEQLQAMLEQTGLEELVERKTSSSDADASKPDPDIIEAALEKGKLRADDALMLGDTPYDVTAAGRAGVRTVALRSGGWNDEGLTGAIAIYDDVAELLARYGESPFAETFVASK